MKTLNKSLIATALSAAVATGALANVDIDAGTSTFTFASEIDTTTAKTYVLAAGAVSVGPLESLPVNSQRWISVEVSGGTFAVAPNADDVTLGNANTTTTAAGATINGGAATLVSGGVGSARAIWSFTTATNVMDIDDNIVIDADWNLTLTGDTAPTITYKIFGDATNALANTNPIATSSAATLLSFPGPAVAVASAAPAATKQIDVTNNATQFTGATADVRHVEIGRITSTSTGARTTIDNGTEFTFDAAFGAATLTVSATDNGFSALADVNTGGLVQSTFTQSGTQAFGDVWIDVDGGCSATDYAAVGASLTAGSINASTATFTIAADALDTLLDHTDNAGNTQGDTSVCMLVNGVSEIPAASFTGTLSVTAESGYDNQSYPLNTNWVTLSKNGSSATLNYVLFPKSQGGAYDQFIRITNNSSTSGDVRLNVIADNGVESGNFDLGEVSGVATSLTNGHSTGLINVDDIWTEAVEANSALSSVTSGKLRIEIEGEFGSGTLEAQALALTPDGFVFLDQ